MMLLSWCSLLSGTFRQRNSYFVGGPKERAAEMQKAVAEFLRHWRKGERAQMEQCLASALAWAFSLLDAFGEVPWRYALAEKFGGRLCSYCGHEQCECPDKRPAPSFFADETEIKEALGFSLRQWMDRLEKKYGHRNRSLGVQNAVGRLYEELTEVTNLIMGPDTLTPLGFSQEMKGELADLLTWVLTVAYVAEIDLEKAMEQRYGNGCPTCRGRVCACPRLLLVGGQLLAHGADSRLGL